MDLVEVRTGRVPAGTGETADLFAGREALEVCPVDYKIGAPKEGDAGNECGTRTGCNWASRR